MNDIRFRKTVKSGMAFSRRCCFASYCARWDDKLERTRKQELLLRSQNKAESDSVSFQITVHRWSRISRFLQGEVSYRPESETTALCRNVEREDEMRNGYMREFM